MGCLEYIKSEIKKLYSTNSTVHISVKLARPKVIVEGTSAKVTGVYRNVFQIEENDSGRPVRHTIKYSDVLIGHVLIAELDYVPMVNVLNKK